MDERVVSRRHRYGYAAGLESAEHALDPTGAVLKHDFVTDRTETRSFGPQHSVGEFVFVPSSPSAAEDEGVLLGLVHDATVDRSDLVVLDAQTLEDVARVHLPVRVPHGFHGSWAAAT